MGRDWEYATDTIPPSQEDVEAVLECRDHESTTKAGCRPLMKCAARCARLAR